MLTKNKKEKPSVSTKRVLVKKETDGSKEKHPLFKQMFLSRFSKLTNGEVSIEEANEKFTFGKVTGTCSFGVVIKVKAPAFYRRACLGGANGIAESFILNEWEVSDLTKLIRIMVLNREALVGRNEKAVWVVKQLERLYLTFKRNSQAGSRKNIEAHYDLSNEFFQLFLDPTLTYSCGIFENDNSTMEEASLAKLKRICDKLALKETDRVVEIGTGWGGFAEFAAKNYGCQVTTTTISKEQFAFAKERIKKAGLENNVTLLLEDYRNLKGKFDKLVSIEMIEAVGHHYFDSFFRTCSDLLTEEGVMALQGILIDERAFERAKHHNDFIKQYIFPGSCIPSVTALMKAVTASSTLKLIHLEDITPHYARTLATWREAFFKNREKIQSLGFSDEFIRTWHYYFSYCEGAFRERYIQTSQFVFQKPLARKAPILGAIS